MALTNEQKRTELINMLRDGMDKLDLSELVDFIRNPDSLVMKNYILNEVQKYIDYFTELKQEAEKL